MARDIGIGIQDFKEMIDNNYFYIDKTDFIKEWWENGDMVTLITRPRRFGKTLTMSMVEQFFSLQYADGKDLFEGLSIWKDEKYRQLQGTYPVIAFSFSDIKEKSFIQARKKICQTIVDLYNKYDFLLEGNLLYEQEKEIFRRVSIDMENYVLSSSIESLSEFLYRYYKKNVIVLLDGYDTPMQEACTYGYLEELMNFFRSFFISTFKTNRRLEQGLMTGITRLSREFDLNNLEVVSTTSKKYETAFGFTEREVSAAIDEYGLTEKEKVKKWYGGFLFGEEKEVYNPWSILNYLNTKEFQVYWEDAGSISFVSRLIRERDYGIKMIMEDLLEQKSFHIELYEEIELDQLNYGSTAVCSYLLADGYLRVESYSMDMDSGREDYEFMLPNEEVHVIFNQMIRRWFSDFSSSYDRFIKGLLEGNVKEMNVCMNEIVPAAAGLFCSQCRLRPYFEANRNLAENIESKEFYHGFVLGLMVELADRYIITSNRESGFGRYDVMLEPKVKEDDAVILEFKVYNSNKEKDLQDTVKAALQQIEDKKYAASLEAKGIQTERIRKYGFAFKGKKVLIG